MGAVENIEQECHELRAENQRLRERVAGLESELFEVQAKANASVAHWQERAYWLERWHLDLNSVMRRRYMVEMLAVLRGIRGVFRAVRRIKWRFLS